jgi:hypothetical protein
MAHPIEVVEASEFADPNRIWGPSGLLFFWRINHELFETSIIINGI